MKVFVPVCDELLIDSKEIELVPFNLEFLGQVPAGRKPANWISDSDYASARRRLWLAREEATRKTA